MAAKEVYRIPGAKNLDGLNLVADVYHYLFKHRIDAFRLNKDEDFLIATYPRTGTTWLCQIVSLLLTPEPDYALALATNLAARSLYLEVSPDRVEPQIMRLTTVPPPRTLKTHLPARMVRKWMDEDKVKVVVSTRNPKDTLASLFHFYKNHKNYNFEQHTWDDFFEHVCAGLQEHGDMYEWLLDWSQHRHNPNVLFVSYEDMKKDLKTQVRQIAAFLGVDASDAHVERVTLDASFGEMKGSGSMPREGWMKDPGKFLREGNVGGWRRYFTLEQNEWFDEKYRKLYEELPIKVHYE